MLRKILLLTCLVLVLGLGQAQAQQTRVISVASDCMWPPMASSFLPL